MNEQVNNAIGGYEAETSMGDAQTARGRHLAENSGTCLPSPALDLQATIKTDNTQALYNALARIDELQTELDEQCRINGLGGERELALMAKVNEQQECIDNLVEAAYREGWREACPSGERGIHAEDFDWEKSNALAYVRERKVV